MINQDVSSVDSLMVPQSPHPIEEGIWKSIVRGPRVDVVVEVMMVDDVA